MEHVTALEGVRISVNLGERRANYLIMKPA